jgi:iron complex transport system ATP-binding protein
MNDQPRHEPNDSDNTPAVQCIGVGVLRGEKYLLRDVDWHVPARGVAAVVGPNGAGKSTLTKLLLGYLWPTRGRLVVDGRLFGETDIAQLRHVVQLVQPAGAIDIDPAITVRDAVGTGFDGTLGVYAELSDRQRDAVESMCREWGIAALADQEYGTLSTGERTRVQIARALITRPRLLVLDEPTAGLDVIASRRLLRTIETMLDRPDRPATVDRAPTTRRTPRQTQTICCWAAGACSRRGPPGAALSDAALATAYEGPVRMLREGRGFASC